MSERIGQYQKKSIREYGKEKGNNNQVVCG